MIHESAIVAPDADLGEHTSVGPFAVVGVDREDLSPVVFGSNCVIRSHSVIYRGTRFGSDCALGHGSLVREECLVGDSVSIGSHTIVEHHVTLASNVRLHSGCFVPEESVLGEGAWLGPGVIVTNAKYPNRPDTKQNLQGVHVGAGAVIGAGSILLPGIQIGTGALVGAGTIVVKDVPAGARVVGNPGRPL